MAAPVWQSKGTDLTGSASTSAVVALPASLAAGDVVIVALYKENSAAVTKPSVDWTEITSGGMPVSTTAPQTCHAFWYRCAGGETGTVTFSWTGSAWRASSASRVTGAAAAGDPIEAVNAAFNNTSASTSPSVSLPDGSGADTLLFWVGTNFVGGNAWGAASPSFTERTDIDVLAVDTRSNVGGLATGSVTATSGISGPQTAVLFSVTSGAPAIPAGMFWSPPRRQILLPSSPLYFPFQRPLWAGEDVAAGSAFTVDQTDSVGLTDTSSIDVTKAITQTDSVGLADSAILDQTKIFTDSAGLTDGTALTVSPVLTDSAGLTDTSLVELSKLVAQTDSAGLTDSAVLNQSKAVTDSAGLTDTAALTQSKVLTDDAGLTDTSLVESGKAIAQTDSAGLTDSQAFSQSRVLSDSTGLTDAASLTASKVLTDSAGLTDTAAVGILRDLAATDSVGLTDATVLFRTAVLTDLVGLSDAAAFSQLRGFTDSAGLTDAATVTTVIPVPPFVPRPSGGFTPRPGSATTPRPSGGTTTRAASGLVPRPSSGFTPRP